MENMAANVKNVLNSELRERFVIGNDNIESGALENILAQTTTKVFWVLHSKIEDPIFLDTAPIVFSSIQEFWLSETIMSEEGLYTLIRSFPFLKSLRIEVNMPIVDQMCRAISQCKQLETLHMIQSKKVTARGIKSIAQGCLNLKVWNLSFTALTANGFKTLIKYVPASIQTLCICGHDTLNDDHVALLVQKCPNLTEIKIHLSNAITANSIIAICQLQHLEMLAIYTCPNVPLSAFRGLAGRTAFKKLSINGNAMYPVSELLEIQALMVGIEITSSIM